MTNSLLFFEIFSNLPRSYINKKSQFSLTPSNIHPQMNTLISIYNIQHIQSFNHKKDKINAFSLLISLLNDVIENGAELIAERFKVHGRIFLAALVVPLNHFILPSNNISRQNFTDFALAEVRQDLRADNMLFGLPSVFF